MIARLRKRFISSAMLAVLVVMVILMVAINVANYYRYNRRLDSMLMLISENMGNIPEFNEADPEHELEDGYVVTLTPETAYSTRYFIVTYDADGNLTDVNIKKVAAVTREEAIEYANEVRISENDFGWCDIYKYYKTQINSKELFVFLDGSTEQDSGKSVMLISFAVAILSYGAIFILVFFMSKKALRPVMESFNKQKRFITDAGHELKTPVTIISANAQVMELMNGKNEWLDSINNQTVRIGKLVNQLITLSRMDEGLPEDVKEQFSISDAVEEVSWGFEAAIKNDGKHMIKNIDPEVTMIGNEGAIREVISILMDNAVKYCDDGGTIEVIVSGGKRPEISVVNTYAAVSELEFENLFDRFYRVDKARTGGNGYGLGLSIAKNIIEINHGTITASDAGNNRVQFTVRF